MNQSAVPKGASMRFLVAQTGARRGYAVPAILARAGMLESFRTDLCGDVGWGKWLAMASFLPVIGRRLRRLGQRRIPAGVRPRTHTYLMPDLRWCWRTLFGDHDPTEQFRIDSFRSIELAQAAIQEGFGAATHVYAMSTEFWPLMIAARTAGLKVVTEVYIVPSFHRILREERRSFPGWEPEPPDVELVAKELGFTNILIEGSDYFICPSEAVRDDLANNWGVDSKRITIVPYGMDPAWLEFEPCPVPTRVLFAGTADLRKGIHYLAMAAQILRGRGRSYDFRIAGHATDLVRQHPMCGNLNFIGRVPRNEMRREYQLADVFVLPSLAEGSSEATYEALASGVPLVVTKATGSVVRDAIEGFVVSERNPEAIANALEELIENRVLRDRMALAARRRAREFTWDQYGDRLLRALRELDVGNGFVQNNH